MDEFTFLPFVSVIDLCNRNAHLMRAPDIGRLSIPANTDARLFADIAREFGGTKATNPPQPGSPRQLRGSATLLMRAAA
nr:hypothetical protein [Mycobacterium sp.]